MSNTLRDRVGTHARVSALRAGRSMEEAEAEQARAYAEVAALPESSPVRWYASYLRRQVRGYEREIEVVRRDREALLSALAEALRISEADAWAIARLGLEGDDGDCGPEPKVEATKP